MKILVVVDMQNDFVTGSLKNEEAMFFSHFYLYKCVIFLFYNRCYKQA